MRARSSSHFTSALAVFALTSFASAQVSLEWERMHQTAPTASESGEALAARAGGGWYSAGGSYVNNPNLPGLHYYAYNPLLERLDDSGQLLWSIVVPVPPDTLRMPVALVPDPSGDVYLGYGSLGARVSRWSSAGANVWTSAVPPTATKVATRGLALAPSGNLLSIVGLPTGAGWAWWSSTGAPLGEVQIAGSPAFGTLVGAHDASGRIAGAHTSATGGVVYSVRDDATLAWSDATVAFQVNALAFGTGGELAAAGFDGTGAPRVRVWDGTGALRYDAALGAPVNGQWRDVAFDRWSGVALAGNDGQDGLVALYDASGALAWQRTWASSLGFQDQLTSVRALDSGDVVAAGWTALDNGVQWWQTQSQLLVAGWTRGGTARWEHRDPSTGSDIERCYELAETSGGSIVSLGTRSRNNFVNTGYTPIGVHVLSLRPQSRSFCFGDALTNACPCGNTSVGGRQEGCANSSGRGARLVDAGLASVSADTLVLTVEGTMPSSACLFFQGNAVEVAPFAQGDGARCVGGALVRLYTRAASGGTVTVPAPGDPSVSSRSAAAGDPLSAGATRYVQVYYRDASATFCPAPQGSTSNVSSGLALSWSP